MRPDVWQVLAGAATSIGALLTAIASVKRRADRRLLRARTENIDAQTHQVRESTVGAELDRVAAILDRAWKRNAELAEMLEECRDREDEVRVRDQVQDAMLMVHAAWDHNVLSVLREVVRVARKLGVSVEVDDEDMQPPPPLRPPAPKRGNDDE